VSRPGDGKNRRRAPRVRIANLIGYSDRRSDKIFNVLGSATTIDLSETGVRLRTHEPLPIGVVLTFEVQLGGDLVNLNGRVVWGEELEPDTSYEFGVSFVDVPEKAKESLRLYVSVKAAKSED
jgi:hypothetical protein